MWIGEVIINFGCFYLNLDCFVIFYVVFMFVFCKIVLWKKRLKFFVYYKKKKKKIEFISVMFIF